jgi:diguanylate cyclase (GGDEF)-like protein
MTTLDDRKLVLIVDDTPANIAMMSNVLKGLYRTKVATNGEKALVLASADEKPDLILLDVLMPGLSGYDVCKRLKADVATREIPVIFLTGQTDAEDERLGFDVGAVDYIHKPFSEALVLARVKTHLELRQALQLAREARDEADEAAQLHAQRLDLIWRAGSTAVDDEAFLRDLIDGASLAIVAGRHFSAAILRLDGDELAIEVATDAPDGDGEVIVGKRIPIDQHREAISANAIEAIPDLPPEQRGSGHWRASVFAPFQVGSTRYVLSFTSREPSPKRFSAFDTSFVDTVAHLCANRLQQRVQFERLRYQTEHDTLTGILSRTSFRARGFAAMRESNAVALLVLNLDNFRHTNDTLGQQTGDALLVEVAARLDAAANEHESVARLGGDSFGILVTNCNSRSEAEVCARRFLRLFEYGFGTGDRENLERVSLGASIGIAVAPQDADGFELLLARADAACYTAKDAGRGRWAFFDIAVEEAYAATRDLKNDLSAALKRDEFTLYFQPHVDLKTRRIGGAEALIRWRHPNRGLVQPDAFIPFAERHGLAGAIGAWVMQEAARASREWRRADPTFRAWFNLSATELRDQTLVPRLREVGGDLSGLGVEITESLAMESVGETRAVMDALHNAGVIVALDDFGTGYSSLAHLKRLPIDVVKIDKAFVTGLPGDQFDSAIVDAVLSIARSYGFETLAEGIELADQAAYLQSAGCMLGQGYFYGRPMPADDFDALYRSHAGRAAS